MSLAFVVIRVFYSDAPQRVLERHVRAVDETAVYYPLLTLRVKADLLVH